MKHSIPAAWAPSWEQVHDKHYSNIVASLNHRLEVAQAANDTQLIALLEREQQAFTKEIAAHELLTPPGVAAKPKVSGLWHRAVEWMTGRTRLEVWQTVDQGGDRWWCAYNPQTGESVYADSETEMRLWIEQHYAQDM